MRGTTTHAERAGAGGGISIHVPREGDDLLEALDDINAWQISIHVPREGDDARGILLPLMAIYFNPRPP